jgi:broad specificity phosphatase PhoE
MRYVEVRRHTDNDGDQLTPEGIAAAEEIGRSQLHTPYAVFVSSGAGRATQMLEILRAAAGQPDVPIVAEPGLRSAVEDRWRESAKAAGDSDIQAAHQGAVLGHDSRRRAGRTMKLKNETQTMVDTKRSM